MISDDSILVDGPALIADHHRLSEEIADLRRQLEESEAGAAAMRKALQLLLAYDADKCVCSHGGKCIWCAGRQALASIAGQQLLAGLAAAEKVCAIMERRTADWGTGDDCIAALVEWRRVKALTESPPA